MRFATISVLALTATAVHAARLGASHNVQHATSVLASLNPLAKARLRDATSQALSVVPKFQKKGNGIALLQQCTEHGDCAGDEYCDENNACWGCGACESFDDAIDGECPPCEGGNGGGDNGPNLSFEQLVCMQENAGPCLWGVMGSDNTEGIMDAIDAADTAAEAVTLLEAFCDNCTGAIDEFEALFDTCNITDAEAQAMFMLIGELLDSSCDDIDCAGNVLWAFNDIEERQDAFCENSVCGLPIVEPLLSQAFRGSNINAECATSFFNLYCLEDAGDYCLQALENVGGGESGEFSIAPFCASTCPAELTIAFDELEELDCGLDISFSPDCDTLDYEFRLLDYCTVNDREEYCIELMMETEFPSECDDVFSGGAVPAPGAEMNGTDETCHEACQTDLEAFANTLGCCTPWMLDVQCVPEEIISIVTDDCGVALGDTCERPVLPEDLGGASVLKAAIVAAAAAVVTAMVAAAL